MLRVHSFRVRAMLPAFLVSAALSGAAETCLPVQGDHISFADLTRADGAFAVLPGDDLVGYAPEPGQIRRFAAAEIERLATARGIGNGHVWHALCFEYPMRIPDRDSILAVLRGSLPTGTEVALLEVQTGTVPDGPFVFPIGGLEPYVEGRTQLWRGYVQYSPTRRFAIWVKVDVRARRPAVVAVRDLQAGSLIAADSVRPETRVDPLRPDSAAVQSVSDAIGRLLLAPVKSGAEVPVRALAEAPLVTTGQTVPVEVRSGRATLRFDAIVQNSARGGDYTSLRNPANGKTFRARIEAGPKAVVLVENPSI